MHYWVSSGIFCTCLWARAQNEAAAVCLSEQWEDKLSCWVVSKPFTSCKRASSNKAFRPQIWKSFKLTRDPFSSLLFKTIFYSMYLSQQNPPASWKSSATSCREITAAVTSPCETHITSNTYALETCTSCQLLDRFCFNPSKGVKPSFLFSSPQCLSLAARTCLRVPISSSTLERDRSTSQYHALLRFWELSQFSAFLKTSTIPLTWM